MDECVQCGVPGWCGSESSEWMRIREKESVDEVLCVVSGSASARMGKIEALPPQ